MNEVHAYLVDWDEFLRQWQRQQPMQDFEWFFEAAHWQGPHWQAQWWVRDYSNLAQRWTRSLSDWFDAGMAYDDLEAGPELKNTFDVFFHGFLPSYDDSQSVHELPGEQELRTGLRFDVTMSPATVGRYWKMAQVLPWDSLKACFQENEQPPELYDWFLEYLQQWFDLFALAVQEQKGVVVLA